MKDRQPNPGPPASTALSCWVEGIGLAALGALTLFFVATSWRKWFDPLIDFGRELYLPWRLANGAVLYRDVAHYFGPFSECFNAALFKYFGASLMVLVTANLAVFATILVVIYVLCRRAWGAGPALLSSAVFVAVFGFSQFVGIGNYNYATPYAHETTHGFLICLLLVIALVRWVENVTLRRSFFAGGLFGLAAVLKPEIMLAAGLITFTAVVVQWRHQKQLRLSTIAAWTGGAILPTLGFIVYFAVCLPWKEAVRGSCAAWLIPITTASFTGGVAQSTFLGFDQPWKHLFQQMSATLQACALIAVIAGAAWLAERTTQRRLRLLLGGLLAGALLWLACYEITWIETGRCLLGLMLIYIFVSGAPLIRRSSPETCHQARLIRLLLAVLATALMARMVLNGRIYQYGYYQAALAGLLVPAVLIGELPMRLGTGRCGRTMIVVGSLALLVPGVLILANESQHILRLKTVAVGEGVDRFYTYPPEIDPTGEIVRVFSETLRKMPRSQTLLVLPEGRMINYLARLPNPASTSYFFGPETCDGLEERVVDQLQRRPPDWVVIISRDLREFGVQRYGENPGSGQLILHWVTENYELAASVGGDPLDFQQHGGCILKRKVASSKMDPSATLIVPVFLEAMTGITRDLTRQGNFAGAIAWDRLVLQSYPDVPALLNNMAWLLIACPDAHIRNGAEAVACAERACKLTNYGVTPMVGTLAAAYAETGRFDDAITTAQKACKLASESGEQGLLKRNQELLEFYRKHQSYHEALAQPSRSFNR